MMNKENASLMLALEALKSGNYQVVNAICEELRKEERKPLAWMTKTGSVWKTKMNDSDIPLYAMPYGDSNV